jgi:hypothetical protein
LRFAELAPVDPPSDGAVFPIPRTTTTMSKESNSTPRTCSNVQIAWLAVAVRLEKSGKESV